MALLRDPITAVDSEGVNVLILDCDFEHRRFLIVEPDGTFSEADWANVRSNWRYQEPKPGQPNYSGWQHSGYSIPEPSKA